MNNYELITNIVLQKLKEGVIPWRSSFRGHRLPNTNWKSKKAYHGINALMTSLMGYHSPYWLTFNQIKEYDKAKLRKGSKGTPILFAKYIEYEDNDGDTQTKSIYKRSYVFNLQDIDGIDCPVMAKMDSLELLDFSPMDVCEKFLEELKPNLCRIEYVDRTKASYSPMLDRIEIANPELFQTEEDYYSTLFHEITHSTGHSSRCDRNLTGSKKSKVYAKEELIAEIGASFMCAETGILNRTVDDNTAYIQYYLKTLRDDPTMVVRASSKAQQAVDWLKEKQLKEVA